MISPGGLHGKGFRGHPAEIVFSMKSKIEIMPIHYCMLELVFFKVLSHVDTVY